MKKFFFTSAVLALGISGPAVGAPVQWLSENGGNDHWYEIIWPNTDAISWSTAKAGAESQEHNGQSGYLATIGSQGEQTFLNGLNAAFAAASALHSLPYVQAWLGGSDATTEGTWEWETGESFSYTNQADNWGLKGADTKDYLAGWKKGTDEWKDCRDSNANKGACQIYKYVVEYNPTQSDSGSSVAAVPLPATLPLVAAGLGMLAFMGRRRKKS